MISILGNFQRILSKNLIKSQNDYLDKIFQDFSYHFFIKENQDISSITHINKILQKQEMNESQIIFISEYTEKERNKKINSDLLFLCFEKNLVIFDQSKIQQFSSFLRNNCGATICPLTENTKNKIQALLNIKLRFNDELKYIQEEIRSFSQKFQIKISKKKTICNFEELYYFISLILENLSGFLIQKSYHKMNFFDRVSNYSYYETQNKEITNLNPDEYIELRNINDKCQNTYLAYHIKQKELFVLKMFDKDSNALFTREKENYMKINHPLFPKYFGYTSIFNQDAIIMEYIKDNTLTEITKVKMCKENKMKIVFQLMIAINYIHSKGFIYRDLKPNNVLFNEKGSIVIIDFDRMIDAISGTRDFSHSFIAPEIINNENYTNKADIYSLGKIIEFIFNDEFSETNSNEYSLLKELCNECLLEQNKRLDILQLIDRFYSNIFSKITVINESQIVHDAILCYSFHNESQNLAYFNFFYYLSEYNHPVSLYNLGKMHETVLQAKRNDFIYYFIHAAELNDVESQFKLGIYYLNQKFLPLDVNKSIHYFSLAANQHHSEALFYLGCLYFSNEFLPRDINKAIKYFKLSSDLNHSMSQYYLGVIYLYGEYIPTNIDKAIFYLTHAANQNFTKAQLILGNIFLTNKYCIADINKSIHYFTLAAEQNCAEAQFNIGIIYLGEYFHPLDLNKAIHYLTLASNNNHTLAQYSLGKVYFTNRYNLRNINKAIKYFSLAANKNNVEAQFYLASIYMTDKHAQDFEKAIYYCTLAANNNHAFSQYNLGNIYLTGTLCPQNIDKGIYYLTLSANQNNIYTQKKLIEIYFEGKIEFKNANIIINILQKLENTNNPIVLSMLGRFYYFERNNVKRDIVKAINYFSRAADLNDTFSQFFLGILYSEGCYVPRDIQKSIYYYTLAAKKNHPGSLNNLGNIYLDKLSPPNINKGMKYLQMSSDLNCSVAQYNLGKRYMNGILVPKDIEKAVYYLTLSVKNGNPHAQLLFGWMYFYGSIFNKDINKAVYYFTQSANKKITHSQFYLGLIYAFDPTIRRDLNRSINYFLLAAKKNHLKANFILGCFYMSGFKIIKKDIDEAIKYYKTGSSFNCQFSKNNLGIIYKNIKRNGNACIYFEEAIKQKNDVLSMFNLAQMYLFGDCCNVDIDESIKLLIRSSNKDFNNSKILLSLAIMKKIKEITIESISIELKNYGNKNESLSDEIYSIIKTNNFENKRFYEIVYSEYSNINFVYNFFQNPQQYALFMNNNMDNTNNDIINISINITKSFYDGFDINI